MGIFHVLLIMVLEKRVKLQSLKFAVSIDQHEGYNNYNAVSTNIHTCTSPTEGIIFF